MRLLSLSLKGLSEQDAAIWIDMVRHSWLVQPRALPMQIVGLLMLATLIHYSSLPTALWLPPWVCMFTIWAAVIPVALHFRRVDLGEHNYRPWRWLLLGWRGLHGLSGGILCGLLYGGLSPEWRIPLLIVVVVFTYGLTFFAIEDLGVAMIGSGPVVLSLLLALLHSGRPADHMLAVLLIAASINGWLAGHAISRRLFEAARLRRHHAELAETLAREVNEVTIAKAHVELANREKSEFFAAASHDLRQPLYSLQLLFDLLRKQLALPTHVELAHKVDVSLTSLRHVFERMFDVARIEAQKVAVEPQVVSVRELFETLDCEFSQQCQDKQLTWRVSPTDDWLLTDPVLALRMLRNLIENAIRYTPAGQVHLRARKKGHLMCLQVWDTGIGISQTDQIQVFRDYFQVKNEARRAQDGLGLGLGVVRRLAALTGAQISLRSRPAKGSCFSMGLPLAQPPSRPAGTAGESNPGRSAPSSGQSSGQGVLIVDDQVDVLDAVSLVLKDSGYTPIAATTAQGTIQNAACLALWPSAILCDHRLGDMGDGFDAIQTLRYEFGDDLPALMITGDMSPDLNVRAQAYHITLIHKPIDRGELLQALENLLVT